MFKWILGLLLGCCSAFVLPTLPSSNTLIISSILSVGMVTSSLWLKHRFNSYFFSAFAVFVSGVLVGVVLSSIHAQWRIEKRIPYPDNNTAHIIEAEVKSLPAIYPEYCQFRIKVMQTTSLYLAERQLLVKHYSKSCDFSLGDTWSLTVKLKPIHGPLNQAGFDYEYYMFERGYDGRGYVKKARHLETASTFSLAYLRQSLYDSLNHFKQAGLFQALIIGEKSNLSQDTKDILKVTGLSHLIAISGLHISIIAGLTFWLVFNAIGLLGLTRSSIKSQAVRWALIISCIVAACYTALADFSLPTVRALIMWSAVSLSLSLQRNQSFMSGLKWALLILLIIDPLSVLSVSFWMSFIAVMVISILLFGRVGENAGWRLKFKRLIQIQLSITIILAIPSLLFFQEASYIGAFLNLIVIPIFSLIILPVLFLCVGLLVLGSKTPLEILDHSFTELFTLANEALPLIEMISLKVSFPSWLLIMIGISLVVCILPLAQAKRPVEVFVIACLTFITSIAFIADTSSLHSHTARDEPAMIVFDVGHGLAVLLTDGQHHILYDTGYGSSGSSAVESYILPSLQKLGISYLDALIVSHKDNDHSGGMIPIMKAFDIDKVIAGDWAMGLIDEGQRVNCKKPFEEQFGAFRLRAIHPDNSEAGSNNNSCVIRVDIKAKESASSVLLPGDIERQPELKLAELNKHLIDVDILLAPHHGSNSSSSYPFLKNVSPQLSVYSTERYGRFKLPHSEVRKRHDILGIHQLSTGCLGQITIGLLSNSVDYARKDRRIWRNSGCLLKMSYPK